MMDRKTTSLMTSHDLETPMFFKVAYFENGSK